MPKRKSSAYYSQLAKRRFANADSTRSHGDSPRVLLSANSYVDSPQVSVDTTSRMESSGSNSSGIKTNSLKLVNTNPLYN